MIFMVRFSGAAALRRSCVHLQLEFQLEIFGAPKFRLAFRQSQVTANEIASELVGGAHHDEAASRWINDEITRFRNGAD
jgi:hypothetical protein